MSIGNGEDSRIWRTDDGGRSWTETFRNTDEAAFYNCLDFYPGGQRGLAVSDPVGGKFRILATDDGGRSWEVLPDRAGCPTRRVSTTSPPAATAWSSPAGPPGSARVARPRVSSGPPTAAGPGRRPTRRCGPARRPESSAWRSARPRHGVAVGGDFDPAVVDPDGSALTRDGRTWTAGGDLAHLGEDAAWISRKLLVVTGESGPEAGTSFSTDGGRTWEPVTGTGGYHTLDCTRDGSCWAAGSGGRIARATVR